MKKLIECISSIINVPSDQLDIKSGPGNIGSWDSLAHIGIVAAIEDTYNFKMSMPEMLSIKTVGDLRDTIKRHGGNIQD